jgi:hypothetical protein
MECYRILVLDQGLQPDPNQNHGGGQTLSPILFVIVNPHSLFAVLRHKSRGYRRAAAVLQFAPQRAFRLLQAAGQPHLHLHKL